MKSLFSKKSFLISSIVILVALFFILSSNFLSLLDRMISWRIHLLWTPILNSFFILISQYIFDTKTLCFAVLIFSIFLFRKNKSQAVLLLSAVGVTAILSEVVKYLFHHARPLMPLIAETSYSFPSSHASISIVLFSILIFMFKDKIRSNFKKNLFVFSSIFLILLIGFSRIYLNVHYLSDVLAGYALGGVIFILSIYFFKKFKASN